MGRYKYAPSDVQVPPSCGTGGIQGNATTEETSPGDVVGFKSVELLVEGPNVYGSDGSGVKRVHIDWYRYDCHRSI